MTTPDSETFDFTYSEPDNKSLSLGSIFSGIRHEIGNPVNSIRIAVSVLKENFDAYSREKVMEYLDRVLTDVERIEGLLLNLKKFTMYDNLSYKEVKIPEFIENSLSHIKPNLEGKGITLRINIEPGTGTLYTDPMALNRVFLNVVENAADALEGITNPVILVNAGRFETGVRISITDNGHGVPGSYWGEIFKPFFSTRPQRTGLGLSIAHRILSKMNGTILLKSGEDTGTAVIIQIPVNNKNDNKSDNKSDFDVQT